MKISRGLTQAYELQNFTFDAAMALKASLTQNGKLTLTRDDATAIQRLVSAWEACQERVRIHRGKPLPGSLKPESKSERDRLRRSRQPRVYTDLIPESHNRHPGTGQEC